MKDDLHLQLLSRQWFDFFALKPTIPFSIGRPFSFSIAPHHLFTRSFDHSLRAPDRPEPTPTRVSSFYFLLSPQAKRFSSNTK